jgi:pseudouridine synthase
MAGLLKPYDAYELVKTLKESVKVPIQLHTHYTAGLASMTLLKAIEAGVDIVGYVTAPCKVALTSETEGCITITEGKYHQIKRMLEVVHNKIVYLERQTFGALSLDPALARGEWRELSPEELAALQEI